MPREAARWKIWREAATKNMSREAIVKQLLKTAAWDMPREAAR